MFRRALYSTRPRRNFYALFFLFLISTILAGLLALPSHSHAQELSRRLILKDGSYQLVTKYEVKGDRVRYMSAERDEWEELPESLVDWPATEKYEKDRVSGVSVPEAAQLDKEIETEHETELAQLPQVAPGLRLPEASGVFLLDNFQGEPQLDEVTQTEGDVNRNTRSNMLHGAINPIASAKQTFELPGSHAPVQSHSQVPSLYINVEDTPGQAAADHSSGGDEKKNNSQANPGNDRSSDRVSDRNESASSRSQGPQQPQQPQQASLPFDRFRIVRTQVKNDKRVVSDFKRAVTGRVSQEQHFEKTNITRIAGGWLKLTPIENLAPGEYALVETSGTEGMNLYVWDFGVNPNAPANVNPWKPIPKEVKPDPAKPVENAK